MTHRPRIAVIQLGARLHYAAPAALARHGMLCRLYTDAHAGTAVARWTARLLGRRAPGPVRRLTARRIPASIPHELVRSSAWASLEIEWMNRMYAERRKSADLAYAKGWGGHRLARLAIRDGFGGADTLYVHPCVCTDAVFEAKRRGMRVVLEAISYPFLRDVERAEMERLGRPVPWEALPENNRRNIDAFRREAVAADLVLAASEYVRQGLLELSLDPARIAVVPYGYDPPAESREPEPVPGRVLFVGAVNHLKGVHHLAAAARILAAREPSVEVRVVGPSAPGMADLPEFAGPLYLGQVPRSEVLVEFCAADAFVFPTLSDGFGIVLLEALACGVPLISTPHCAGLTEHGVNGLLIPVGDPLAIANAISAIVNDRNLRQRLSSAATATAQKYTLSAYADRLIAAIH